jgi:predicted extracellular nuclease
VFTSPHSRRRTASARRQLLAVVTAAFIVLQPLLFAVPQVGAQTRKKDGVTPVSSTPIIVLPSAGDPAPAISTSVVISQVYGGGGNAGATLRNDYIELFNRGASSVNLTGWSVQYASPTGTGNFSANVTNLSGTINPGQYYLVQEASQAAVGALLPTPDATGNIAMGAGGGKVIVANTTTGLACNGNANTCSPAQLANIIDLVGYGNSNFFEGGGPAPTPSATLSDFRGLGGCTETDNNNTDFATATPAARNTASPLNPCAGGGPTSPSGIGAANPSTVTAGNSTLLTVTVTPGTNPTSTGLAVTGNLSTIGGSATQQFFDNATNGDVTAGDNIFSFNATVTAGTTAGAKSLPVTITDAQARTGNTTIALTVQVPAGACGDAFTPIYTIQGSGTATPIPGSATTEGVVVGDFQGANNLKGFYIQDPTGDANTATSDGIYVFDGDTPAVPVAVGDRVRVNGTVSEAFNNTQIAPSSVQVCSTGNTLPAPTVVDLPEAVNNDLERFENMLTTFPETLTVTGNFTWGRFGELVLSADGRAFQQNSFDRPNSAGALARASLNARAYIVLDDGQSIQNPNPIPYISPDNTRRTGDTTTGLTGVLTFDFSEYRVQPTAPVTFAQANPRPAAPAAVGGNLKVASSNVLNYFNGNGAGGGFPTSRGASTLAEFNRQRDKVIAALTTMNVDVIGIIEMENDGFGAQSALQDLINGMNAATAPGTYAGLDSPNPGTDLIKNAIIYKPASVTPVGAQVNDVNAVWDQARPPLAQTFQHNGNGEKFIFIVNHFTSKGCSANDTGADADQGDGQGCDNFQRTQQAQRLLVFIQDRKTAAGDSDVLSMGDYNAYGEEDPLFILEQDSTDALADGAGGLVSESKRFVSLLDRYSFQFDSQFGELDHALATKSMNNQVSGATIWHINADEPVIIDYNQEFKTPPNGTGSPDLYTPTPFRASDHDPLIVGLNLSNTSQPVGTVNISEFRLRGPSGTLDEFIEFYNNTESEINVSTTDGSAGWALVASDGAVRFTIPNGTKIPPRGHLLAANSAYSLSGYGGPGAASPNIPYTTDIPDGSGIALFRTATPANFTTDNRLDAAGYTGVPVLYREGAGFPTGGNEIGGNIEYTFFRSLARSSNGLPKDTGDNAADFIGVSVFANPTGQGTNLGAPGPENLSSPIQRNSQFTVALLDPNASSASPPNRDRNFASNPGNNSPNGTLTIRRTYTNNTGLEVTRLRFRIIEITTSRSPAVAGQADLRAINSSDTQVLVNSVLVDVEGTTVEQPPTQTSGGGWNTTWRVDLAETISNGESVNVQFVLGVQQPGRFFIFLNIEADNFINGGSAVVESPNVWRGMKKQKQKR